MQNREPRGYHRCRKNRRSPRFQNKIAARSGFPTPRGRPIALRLWANARMTRTRSTPPALKPPPIDLPSTPVSNRGGKSTYPQTPVLKGRDALAHAFAGLGTSLISGGFIVMCVLSFVSPGAAAKTYGIDPSGHVRAHGLRDGMIGVATFTLHVMKRSALRVWLPVVALVPLGDAAVAASWGDSSSSACQAQIAAAGLVLLLAVAVHFDPLLPRASLISVYNV